jgi:hypothetical protein
MPTFTKTKNHYDGATELSSDPVVAYYDDLVSPIECDYIINLAKDKIQRAKVSLDKESAIIPGRSGSNCWLRYAEDAIVKSIGARIAALVGIPLENAEALQVIHYDFSQEYRGHYDAYDLSTERGQRCCKFGGQRLVTALIYLNDVPKGGATTFAKLNTEVAAKKGRVALFHNTSDDQSKPHPKSFHAGSPVISGEKWACNIWFHARPIKEKQDFSSYGFEIQVQQDKETIAL